MFYTFLTCISDEDKKKAAEQRKAKKASTATHPTTATPSSQNSDANSDFSDSTNNTAASTSTNDRARQPPRHRGYRPSEALPERQLSSTPMRELEDEEAQEEEEVRKMSGKSQAEAEALPKHHAQLYQLYGKQADYFLHPKPAQAVPRRRPTHPKLKNQKGQHPFFCSTRASGF